jgi:hypothetical protein
MSKKRGAYRSRKLQTKKRDDERRRESSGTEAFWSFAEKKIWVSIKGREQKPVPPVRRLYIKTEDIDPETEAELGNAIEGKSEKFDKYAAARMIVAVAMSKGLIRE